VQLGYFWRAAQAGRLRGAATRVAHSVSLVVSVIVTASSTKTSTSTRSEFSQPAATAITITGTALVK